MFRQNLHPHKNQNHAAGYLCPGFQAKPEEMSGGGFDHGEKQRYNRLKILLYEQIRKHIVTVQ